MNVARIIKISLILLVVIAALYLIPQAFTLNNLKPDVIAALNKEAGLNTQIDGDIEIALIPSTSLTLKQVTINIPESAPINISQIVVNTSFIALLSGNVEITGVEIQGASISSALFNTLSSATKRGDGAKSNLQSLSLSDVNVTINPESNFFGQLNKITGVFKYTPNESFRFKGSFYADDDLDNIYTSDIDLNVVEKPGSSSSYIKFGNKYINLEFNGDLTNDGSFALDGNIVSSLKSNNDNQNLSSISQAILNDGITMKSSLKMNRGEISLNSISVSSENISKIIGQASLLLGYTSELSLNIEADTINLDKMLAKLPKSQANNTNSPEEIIKSFLISFDFYIPSTISGSISAICKEIIINEKPIQNVTLDSSIFEGRFILSNSSADMPGNAKMNFSGALSHNDIRPKFEGVLNLEVNNYKDFATWTNLEADFLDRFSKDKLVIESVVSIIPRSIKFENTNINWGALKLLGRFNLRNTGEKKLNVRASFRLNELDSNAYKISDSIDSFISEMYAYDFDKSGNRIYSLTDDFKWLRNFPIDLNIDILIDQFKFRDVDFKKFFASTNVSSNYINIDQFMVDAQDISANGSIGLSTSGIAPKLKADITVTSMNEGILQRLMPDDALLLAKQQEVIGQQPKEVVQFVKPGSINFFGLNNFWADLRIKVDNYNSPSLTYQNLDFKGQTQDGILTIESLTADIFEGKMELVGSVIFNTLVPYYTATLAINNFQLDEFLKYYASFNKVGGYFSTSGTISSKGSDRDEIYANLAADFNVLGKQVEWNGFDVGGLVKLTETKAGLPDKIQKMNIYTKEGQTVFDSLQASLKIESGIATISNATFANNRVSGAYSASIDMKNSLFSGVSRVSFLPYGKAGAITIDVSGTGKLSDYQPVLNMDKFVKFLRDDANTREKPADQKANSLLRNKKI